MEHPLLIATQLYGSTLIQEVFEQVKASSPEVAHRHYADLKMERHRECIEMLWELPDDSLDYESPVK